MKCIASLWSADLANLERDIKKVEPYVDRFHLDVADGHYVKNLLFFPDLVAAIRKCTVRPLEMHLMTQNPLDWIEPFLEAGVDGFVFCLDTVKDNRLIQDLRSVGVSVGISIAVQEPIRFLEPYLPELDIVTVMGTPLGVKGQAMDAAVPARVRSLVELRTKANLAYEIQADGGIRRETISILSGAGTNSVVAGSLLFGNDPQEISKLLAT